LKLEVRNLLKRYGSLTAVDNLSFSMEKPGVFGLIGTNGAGKTTTIRMMLGILSKDGGEALWNGKSISRESVSFGYMPEDRGIYMKSKVGEQLQYFGMLRGMGKSEAHASAVKWMRRLGVYEHAFSAADKLSKGNQQKVQLIASLISNPDLIVLDEPFSGLDPVNTDVLRDVIGEMVEEGKHVLLSSHQMNVVEDYCENLVLLHRGKAVLSGSLRKIKSGYGHTNLIVSCREDISGLAEENGLSLLDVRADEEEYRISGDEMAQTFLRALVEKGVYPVKYEIREPSLHQIFVEKAGEGA